MWITSVQSDWSHTKQALASFQGWSVDILTPKASVLTGGHWVSSEQPLLRISRLEFSSPSLYKSVENSAEFTSLWAEWTQT